LSAIKKLAKQTATYGFSTILGRLLNYSLVPLHLRVFAPAEYAPIGDLYSYVAFLGVLLTYGLETAYFRFSRSEENPEKVYNTAYISHLISSAIFLTIFLVFASPIAGFLKYPGHVEYVILFTFIVVFDALTAIPLARLRKENRAKRFVSVRFTNISINVVFNLIFLLLLPWLVTQGIEVPFYDKTIGVGYVFIANLISSGFTLVLLMPQLRKVHFNFDRELWKRMMVYSWPILIMGFAGMVNEVFDRILLKYLLPPDTQQYLVGIYSACYKISIFMTLFVQMFRFAAEPFFFGQAEDKNSYKVYADVMKYFVLAGGLIFLGVMLYLDLVKDILIGNPEYYPGLIIVPWLLLANLFLGMFFNYSFWFKLTDKTTAGASISIFGAVVTLLLNWLLIPIMGYLGSAIATFICYAAMMLACYWMGRKRFPVPYDNARILFYLALAVGLYLVSLRLGVTGILQYGANTVLLLLYVGIAYLIEKPKKALI
jgi:O-antigen/teichoic acid export membrane protein